MPSRKYATKTRGRPFQAGNPGKPKGARHRLSLLAERLMADDIDGIVNKVIKAAKAGNMVAARLILDRLWPVPKGHTIGSERAPNVASAADVLKAHSSLIKAVSVGNLTTDAAQAISELFERQLKIIETTVIEDRLKALEQRITSANGSRPNEEDN